MGCDIHFHSEVKIKGKWHHHAEKHVQRNYALFAKMANVRNNGRIRPISEPKGIPKNATLLTKMHIKQYGTDGHSHSWLSAREIVELYQFIRGNENDFEHMWLYDNMPYFMGNHFDGFETDKEYWEKFGVEDVRFVFFFDN